MQKRILAALLCLLLLMTAIPYAAFAESTTGTVYGLDEGSPLRVRQAPVDGEVIAQLYNNDVVTILATSEDGGWYQVVTPSGVTGWSSATYIRINQNKPDPLPEGATGTVFNINSGSKLYVRKEASSSATVLDKLSNGDVVAVLAASEDGKWYQVTTASGVTGWCTAAYIRINKSYETEEEFEAYLTEQGFPEDYKVTLRNLHAHYPNWLFEAAVLPMTFTEAVTAESEVLKNALDVDEYPEAWLSMEYGAYDWKTGTYVELDSGGWVTPTADITAYFMDPRNWLDFTYIFQFENLLYSDKHSVTGLTAILPTKYDGYAADVLSAARDANVNAYHLATRMTQEGTKIDGTWPGYEGYYNFFNIGAYAHSGNGAVTNGAIYAKKQGWDTPYKCILGSAQQLGKNYIHKRQNTVYYQKFNVAGENLYNHQYMSNINAPTAESKIRASKATAEELAGGISFVIPVYKEMPETVSQKPSEKGNNNNFLDSLTVEGFSLTPTFDRYTMEYAVEVTKETTEIKVAAVTNNKEATLNGTGTIPLHKGENLIPVTVTATSGAVRTYTLSVFCEADVPDPPPDLPPDPPVVPPATPTPVIEGKTYVIGETVTGVEPETAVADFITALAVKDGTAKVTATDGKEKAGGVIATGDTLTVSDADGNVCITLPVVIYGDATGDGKVNSQDLRRIQRHILGVAALEGHPLTAADVNRDGKVNSQDLRQAQRYILGLTATLQPAPQQGDSTTTTTPTDSTTTTTTTS